MARKTNSNGTTAIVETPVEAVEEMPTLATIEAAVGVSPVEAKPKRTRKPAAAKASEAKAKAATKPKAAEAKPEPKPELPDLSKALVSALRERGVKVTLRLSPKGAYSTILTEGDEPIGYIQKQTAKGIRVELRADNYASAEEIANVADVLASISASRKARKGKAS